MPNFQVIYNLLGFSSPVNILKSYFCFRWDFVVHSTAPSASLAYCASTQVTSMQLDYSEKLFTRLERCGACSQKWIHQHRENYKSERDKYCRRTPSITIYSQKAASALQSHSELMNGVYFRPFCWVLDRVLCAVVHIDDSRHAIVMRNILHFMHFVLAVCLCKIIMALVCSTFPIMAVFGVQILLLL